MRERENFISLLLSLIGMPSPKTRLERLNEILRILEEKGGKAKFREVFAALALKYGVTRKTFWDYLETLKTAGKIDYPTAFLRHQEDDIEIRIV